MEASAHSAHRRIRVTRGTLRTVDVQRRRGDGRRGLLDVGRRCHCDRRDRFLSVLQAIRTLEKFSVQEDEARMAQQCLSGEIEDSRSRTVRGEGSGEAHDGHRVHRGDHQDGARGDERETIRG